ncbi:hypothetical protein SAMN05444280_14617 [Tangfeifania diversioriginum]|uniref:Uncharacterized protein n=1 Tax=Tangfeifania diversioriginum TaxID=1168035 RepID=A0A1M6NTZ7_9BACT|nr:hypothetical protein SAMN05444280_14617 [Tangfeifania diversioriginum]
MPQSHENTKKHKGLIICKLFFVKTSYISVLVAGIDFSEYALSTIL